MTNFDHPTETKLDKLEAVQKASCSANKGPGNVTWKESEKEMGLPQRREHWKHCGYSSYMWSRETTAGYSSGPQMVEEEGEQPEQGWNRASHDLRGETPCLVTIVHKTPSPGREQGNPTGAWLGNLKSSLRKQGNKEKAGLSGANCSQFSFLTASRSSKRQV